jgi:hypothetical protein
MLVKLIRFWRNLCRWRYQTSRARMVLIRYGRFLLISSRFSGNNHLFLGTLPVFFLEILTFILLHCVQNLLKPLCSIIYTVYIYIYVYIFIFIYIYIYLYYCVTSTLTRLFVFCYLYDLTYVWIGIAFLYNIFYVLTDLTYYDT